MARYIDLDDDEIIYCGNDGEYERYNIPTDIRTADVVERKRGEWIQDRLVSTNGGTYGVRRCSNCENYYQDVGYGWNYCPNCGAEMSGGEKYVR